MSHLPLINESTSSIAWRLNAIKQKKGINKIWRFINSESLFYCLSDRGDRKVHEEYNNKST